MPPPCSLSATDISQSDSVPQSSSPEYLLTSPLLGVKPVVIELTDFKTKEKVDEIEVDACLVATGRAPYTSGLNLSAIGVATDRRGFVPVNEKMQVRLHTCVAMPEYEEGW